MKLDTRNYRKVLVIGSILLVFFVLCQCNTMKAGSFSGMDNVENLAIMNKDGSITYTAKDTTAVSSIRFATYGFSVEPEMTYGKPNYKTNGKFWLKDGQKEEVVDGSVTYVKYTFSAEQVEKVFKKSGISAAEIQKSGGYIYLNSIFKVHYCNSKGDVYKTSGYKYTLSDIKNAANWRNPNDFDDHFDIKVKFDAEDVPVYVTKYLIIDGKLKKVDSEKVDVVRVFSKFTAKASLADYRIEYNGKSYYLYRSSWSDYDNPVKNYEIGNIRKQFDIVYDNFHPITNTSAYLSRLPAVRGRSYEVPMGGIEITYWYRYRSNKKTVTPTENMQKDMEEPETSAVINAMNRGNEEFDSEEGIPTSEYQYVNVLANEYLLSYRFQEYAGTKTYSQKKEYIEIDEDGKKVTKTEEIAVDREYSYWKIADLKVYALSSATVKNYSLPGEGVTVSPTTYQTPEVSYCIYGDNMKEPEDGTDEVGEIQVRNDKLVFNGEVIMDSSFVEKDTDNPKEIAESGLIDENVLFLQNQVIDANKKNGEYESSGYVTYTCIANTGGSIGQTKKYTIDTINGVIIHTPTINNGNVIGCKEYNQQLYPDQGVPSLVLDRYFSVECGTEGWHSDLKGYQYRDYAKYIAKKEVKFPFDVYKGSTYIAAGTWDDIVEGQAYYIPTWVCEGYYDVEFRTRTINCDVNNGIDFTEESANTDYTNYVATNSCCVEVSGRLYGLTMYDESNYPLWESVFRKTDSLELTGFNYKVGTKNQNGTNTGRYTQYTFPLINGSHPLFQNIGVLKTGYVSRFYLTTIGSMYEDADDSIVIEPSFYYVSADGKTVEQVDVYYTETINGKKTSLVKVGSETDSLNTKQLRIGDTYVSVPAEELQRKAMLTGRTLKEVKGDTAEIYSFGKIVISDALRTYIGNEYIPNGVLPSGVNEKNAQMSVQKWYFEYYLPSEVHVCSKGTDVAGYLKTKGIDYSESFWKSGGYLKVVFDIISVENGSENLSYINKSNARNGYCNMWKAEGFSYTKSDYAGTEFSFSDGDTLLYYLSNKDGVPNENNPDTSSEPVPSTHVPYNPGSAADDYVSGGTH